jgi:hypothetical protein
VGREKRFEECIGQADFKNHCILPFNRRIQLTMQMETPLIAAKQAQAAPPTRKPYSHQPDLQCRWPACGTDRHWLRKPLLTNGHSPEDDHVVARSLEGVRIDFGRGLVWLALDWLQPSSSVDSRVLRRLCVACELCFLDGI